MGRDEAFASVHFPETQEEASAARQRLVFDELFRLEISLAMQKQRQIDDATGIRHDSSGEMVGAFVDALPYELTGAQTRSIDEIQPDMVSPHPMHRLLQGEVGSGKTGRGGRCVADRRAEWLPGCGDGPDRGAGGAALPRDA